MAVGGDYFDYLTMPGGKLGVAVADVSGHDIGASIFIAQTRAYLRGAGGSQNQLGDLVAGPESLPGEQLPGSAVCDLVPGPTRPEAGRV